MKSKMCGVHMAGSVFAALLGQRWVNTFVFSCLHVYLEHTGT